MNASEKAAATRAARQPIPVPGTPDYTAYRHGLRSSKSTPLTVPVCPALGRPVAEPPADAAWLEHLRYERQARRTIGAAQDAVAAEVVTSDHGAKLLAPPRADLPVVIERLWTTGCMSTMDIAEVCGCAEATVCQILVRDGELREASQ